jgi:hypothetical protein
MIYLKSVLAGIAGSILGYGLRVIIVLSIGSNPPLGFQIISGPAIVMTVLGFGVGYLLLFSKLQRRGPII